jgi:hypothetical protein
LHHWVNTSAGGLLVPKDIIYPTLHVFPQVGFKYLCNKNGDI